MAISDRTRKILWGRSGNLCAFCRQLLVAERTPHDAESVVGDECHIIGEKPTAARGAMGVGKNDLDNYDNLLLLCKVHHKLVDDQPDTYPVEKLHKLKSAHELWVKERLSGNPGSVPKVKLLKRVDTGKDLANIIDGSHAHIFEHDELETEAETKLVAGFLGNLEDWGEIWNHLDSGQRVEARFNIASTIKEIEATGFLVFGYRDKRKMKQKLAGEIFDWNVAIIFVVRATNPAITELGDLATLFSQTGQWMS